MGKYESLLGATEFAPKGKYESRVESYFHKRNSPMEIALPHPQKEHRKGRCKQV